MAGSLSSLLVRLWTRVPMRRVLRHGEKGRIPGLAGRVSIGGRRLAMAPQALVYLADSILYLSSILRDQPRQIDRYIDYFGGGAQDERAREEGRSRSEEHTSELQSPYDLVCRPLLQ